MILALVVLSVIVLFHEFGHFLLARLNGITVVEFSLGFGPRLLSHVSKKSGTRYSWKLFPFGGSCAMLGEFGDEEGESALEDGSGVSFFSRSPAARMSVVAAGLCIRHGHRILVRLRSGKDPGGDAGPGGGCGRA